MKNFKMEKAFSGPFLVSRTGDPEWTVRWINMHLLRLMKISQKVLIHSYNRNVVMEVEII